MEGLLVVACFCFEASSSFPFHLPSAGVAGGTSFSAMGGYSLFVLKLMHVDDSSHCRVIPYHFGQWKVANYLHTLTIKSSASLYILSPKQLIGPLTAMSNSEINFGTAQPSVTVVNINADASPTMFRVDKDDVGTTEILLRLATWLKEEEALIINITVSPTNLCLVAALKDDWIPRFGKALHGQEYTPYTA